jgi:endonuclease/exonuclease/phosphatase family metal-dependent hydrolase
MRPLLLILPLLLTACPAPPQDPAQAAPPVEDTALEPAPDLPSGDDAAPDLPLDEPTPVTVATWNVERFFDLRCDSGRCGWGDYEELPTPEQFQAQAQRIADAIDALDADVVLLQEIESQECLDELQRLLPEPYPVAVLGETGGDASVDVAILARGELVRTRGHRDQPIPLDGGGTTRFARELLEVHLRLQGRDLIAFSAHFKSKSGDDPARRLAEARAARQIALDTSLEHPDALVILGGDLNDTPDSEPLGALTEDQRLLRVAEDIAPEDWTYLWQNRTQAIDHLLLATDARGQYLPASAMVLRGGRGDSYGGSDHCALTALFTWTEN